TKNNVTDTIPPIIPALPAKISITVVPRITKPTSQVLLRREFKVKAKRRSVPADATRPFEEAFKRPSSKAVEGSANARVTVCRRFGKDGFVTVVNPFISEGLRVNQLEVEINWSISS